MAAIGETTGVVKGEAVRRVNTQAGEYPELAYLVSCYPAVSHTFILREVVRLRKFGFRIHTVSINSPIELSAFTEAETQEVESTFYVKRRGVVRIVGDHIRSFVSRPWQYVRGMWLALQLTSLDLAHLLHHISYFVEAVVVGEWLRRNRLHHLHVHFANAGSTVALIVSKMYPVRYSITVHGSDEFYGVAFYRLKEKVEGASFICCVSQFCRSQLMRITSPELRDKFEICPLGVDPQQFQPVLHAQGGTFNICCVGRLVVGKGQGVLFEAVPEILRTHHNVHLHLVGDGPDKHVLEKTAHDYGIAANVTFHGAVNQRRVREILASADAFVLPSFAEGVPVSLMEAMAMCIPCISTTVAGIPELITSGVDGILVPPSDAEKLGGAIRKLIEDPDYRLRLGLAGRQTVIDRYNLQVNVAHLVHVFQKRVCQRAQDMTPNP